MVMSPDPRCKFRIFLFCPNSTFYIRKSHTISGGKALYFRSYQQELSLGGGGGGGKYPPCVFWVNVYVGKVMTCEQEPDNEHDEHAVAVNRKGGIGWARAH